MNKQKLSQVANKNSNNDIEKISKFELKKDLLLKYIKTKLISLFNLDNIDPVITI
jgi:hypothetical protein